MEHLLTLSNPWFEHVRCGRKAYEGRRRTAKVKAIDVGGRYRVPASRERRLLPHARVEAVLHFPSFEAALNELPLDEVLPGVATAEEGVAVYQAFVSLGTQEKDGVTMIRVCPLVTFGKERDCPVCLDLALLSG